MTKELFQSTPPRRERPITPLQLQEQINISIHAPAKGATKQQLLKSMVARYFNPRPREGSDLQGLPLFRCYKYFNPRPREGSDCPKWSKRCDPTNFNPRPREGSDAGLSDSERALGYISIHAPAKGATIFIVVSSLKGVYFNPRPREGSDGRN